MSYTFESVYALTKDNIEDVEWEMVTVLLPQCTDISHLRRWP